jgi:hypothetical protein
VIRRTIALGSTTGDPSTNGYASGVDNATLTYAYSMGGVTWAPIGNSAAWDTAAVTDGVYVVRVSVTDHAGNAVTSSSVTVKIDRGAGRPGPEPAQHAHPEWNRS